MSNGFSWLHLTDMHFGDPAQGSLWPTFEREFHEDLARLADHCPPWDLVLLTGDLAYRGSASEYALATGFLERLWEHLGTLGSQPALVAVPGNHDLARPVPRTQRGIVARALLPDLTSTPERWEELWSSPASPYRKLVQRAFSAYLEWWAAVAHLHPQAMTQGVLPGDLSMVLCRGDARLGLVGLNSAWTQLTDEPAKGRLLLGAEQFHHVCGQDCARWVQDQDVSLLLTHHGLDWLDQACRDELSSEVMRPGWFPLHLYGHRHEPAHAAVARGGADATHRWQAPSLFGLEHWGHGAASGPRVHGYEAGFAEILAEGVALTRWPRILMRQEAGHYRLVPDHRQQLTEDEATPQARVPSSRRPHAAPSPAAGAGRRTPRVNLGRLPTGTPVLVGRDQWLARLDEAWADPATNLACMVAFGGVGKSSLVRHWLSRQHPGYGGAALVYGWSFYRQGSSDALTAADEFIDAALRWFKDEDPSQGTPWDRGCRLANLVAQRRTLLILDGLEPHQWPLGPHAGEIKDDALKALLHELAAHNQGLCVVTTRLPLAGLADYPQSTAQLDLDHLSAEAGAELLRTLGVHGPDANLAQASERFGGHCLALTLLGTYLRDACGGDIAAERSVDLLAEDDRQGGHAERVMSSYARELGPAELSVLRMVSLFDRPARAEALAALREPPIPGLSAPVRSELSYRMAVDGLMRTRLVTQDAGPPDELECHPLVREYFQREFRQAQPEAHRAGHSRLYEFYRDSVPPYPVTLEEMGPLFAAVAHACEAGRHDEAFREVYRRRIQRGDRFFSTRSLGAFNADLATLTGFFEVVWSKPLGSFKLSDQAFLLTEAGVALRALGRLEEALAPTQAALALWLQSTDWLDAAGTARAWGQILVTLGRIAEAISAAERSVAYAERSGDDGQLVLCMSRLAGILHQAGRLAEAREQFERAERLHARREPERPKLYFYAGYLYCDLLLDDGRYDEAMSRAALIERWEAEGDSLPISMAFAKLIQGQACHASGEPETAKAHLGAAVTAFRVAAEQPHLPRASVALARLYIELGEWDKAAGELARAEAVCRRGQMRLHLADCTLAAAELHLARRDLSAAKAALAQAEQLVREAGFLRRQAALSRLQARLERAAAGGAA